MKYKEFPPSFWEKINKVLDEVSQQETRPVAAFDADGTLWDTDLGEGFFDYLIQNKLVPLPSDPWGHYENLKKSPGGPEPAYLWLAQILKGVSFGTAKEWADSAVKANSPLPFFPEQKKLMELFHSKGVHIYIVTASVKWAVEPGARLLGLSSDQVLGIETEVREGFITDRQKGQLTYRKGKADVLLKNTNGQKPFFCSGNTMGDFDLLKTSSHLQLVVRGTRPDDRNFRTEMELAAKATELGWLSHNFA